MMMLLCTEPSKGLLSHSEEKPSPGYKPWGDPCDLSDQSCFLRSCLSASPLQLCCSLCCSSHVGCSLPFLGVTSHVLFALPCPYTNITFSVGASLVLPVYIEPHLHPIFDTLLTFSPFQPYPNLLHICLLSRPTRMKLQEGRTLFCSLLNPTV